MAAAGSYISITALVILIRLAINLNLCLEATPIPPSGRNTQFIRTSCRNTLYPNLCFTTFSRYATRIRGSPRLLATTALSVAFNTTRSTTKTMINLSKHHGLKRREAAALRDCVEQIGDSVDELKDSIKEISQPGDNDFHRLMSDIQTWVSAALTNDDTCMDGFSGKCRKRNFKTNVRRRIVKVARLTSIALDFVDRYAAAPPH
ncbi:21 kDa protein-like [Durio zibethinus]|uniref:21 kDa protein-like n=1 Tax=Durio zibethinus TaxID=66656 RepID=A0A6P5Y9W4_DURZI|nr:21 kDa protein-like [Durio zibethinus]